MIYNSSLSSAYVLDILEILVQDSFLQNKNCNKKSINCVGLFSLKRSWQTVTEVVTSVLLNHHFEPEIYCLTAVFCFGSFQSFIIENFMSEPSIQEQLLIDELYFSPNQEVSLQSNLDLTQIILIMKNMQWSLINVIISYKLRLHKNPFLNFTYHQLEYEIYSDCERKIGKVAPSCNWEQQVFACSKFLHFLSIL